MVVALVEGIGPGSALARAIEPRLWVWDTQDELLAVIAEQVDRVARMVVLGFSSGKTNQRPLQLKRPEVPDQRTGTTMAEFQSMMQAQDDTFRVHVRRKGGDEPSG